MLARIEATTLYKENCAAQNTSVQKISTSLSITTPRRKLRQKRLEQAADLVSARNRSIVIGRQSWPTDNASARFNDDIEDTSIIENICTFSSNAHLPLSPGGGFLK